MNICKTCWREFENENMKKDMSGKLTDQCNKCYSFIGKGVGYSDFESIAEADKWFTGIAERREKYE